MSSKKELSTKARKIIDKLNKRQYLAIPDSGQALSINLGRYAAIIESRHFQRQKSLNQLANAHIVFPKARHSRFEHAIDTGMRQEARGRFWAEFGMITEEQADHLTALGLIHDSWHGPSSHVLDRVCKIDHDTRAMQKIYEFRKQIEACGLNFAMMEALCQETDPLYLAIKHHPLGTDKFSYLTLDAHYCDSGKLDLRRLPPHTYWLDGELMVDVTCLDDAIDLKWFYIKMYRDIYQKKACLISQRVLEKEIYHLLASRRLHEDALWEMIDEELSAKICTAKRGRKGYEKYRFRGSKCVVAFRMNGFGFVENISGKKMRVIEKDEAFLDLLSEKENSSPAVLEKKERELARVLGIDPLDLDIVPPMARFRFAPPPIRIVNSYTTKLDTEIYPGNHRAMEERARAYTVLRICVSKELRNKVYKQAKLIEEFFDDWVKELSNPT